MKVGPLFRIYYSALWEDNSIPLIHDICDHFIGSIYQNIFKGDAPTFLERARALISTMGIGMLVSTSHTSESGVATLSIYCRG